MFALKIGCVLTITVVIAWSTSCSKKSEEDCNCTNKHNLPQPVKIFRKGSGFSLTSYFFSLDLLTGDASYEKTDGQDSEAECNGNLNVADELVDWGAAAQLEACTRVLNNPISDGFINAMILYFPNSETLPDSLTTNTIDNWVTVELQENFVNSVGGRQQFDCNGQFAIDSLITAKAPCIGIE